MMIPMTCMVDLKLVKDWHIFPFTSSYIGLANSRLSKKESGMCSGLHFLKVNKTEHIFALHLSIKSEPRFLPGSVM